jgi:hypothetical protein
MVTELVCPTFYPVLLFLLTLDPEIHVGGLDAVLKLQTIELGTLNLLGYQPAVRLISHLASPCVEEVTYHFDCSDYKVASHINVEWEKEKAQENLSGLDDALVSDRFPCLRKVKLLCRWSWWDRGGREMIEEALPKCSQRGLLLIIGKKSGW